MDSLRLIIAIIGFIIVAGIYLKFRSSDDNLLFWIKKKLNPAYKHSSAESIDLDDDLIPVLTPIDDEPDSSDFEALSQVISGRDKVEEYTKQQEFAFNAVDDASESGPETLLIILYIMSPKGHVFTGEGLHAVMTSAGLTHGEHKIYHYMQGGQAVFSVANAIEPGFFELSELKSTATPGLALFLQLPGPIECRKAFNTMLDISKRLEKALTGILCDENRSALTQQTISHLKEKVDAYRMKQQASKRIKHH